MTQDTYWHIYYDAETIARSESIREEFRIATAEVALHVDAYLRSDSNAPILLLTHGEGSYTRMLVRLALALYDLGISTLALDQRGQGLSDGPEGDYSLPQLAQDVLDGAHWARRTFSGPLFLGGINQGGWLAYQAAALGAPVIGLALHELYDFSDSRGALSASRLSGMAGLPGGATLTGAAIRALMAVSPRLRLPYDTAARFTGLLDERDNGHFEAWQSDPFPGRAVSVRYAASTLGASPALPYEQNALPVLVINPMRDRLVDPQVTQRNFARLGGPKTYRELDYGHWSLLEPFAREWAGLASAWMEGILGSNL